MRLLVRVKPHLFIVCLSPLTWHVHTGRRVPNKPPSSPNVHSTYIVSVLQYHSEAHPPHVLLVRKHVKWLQCVSVCITQVIQTAYKIICKYWDLTCIKKLCVNNNNNNNNNNNIIIISRNKSRTQGSHIVEQTNTNWQNHSQQQTRHYNPWQWKGNMCVNRRCNLRRQKCD